MNKMHGKGDFKSLLPTTQTAFAKIAGVSIGTVEAIVSGRNVNLISAEKVSATLNLPLDKIFSPVDRGKLSGKTLLHYHRLLSSMLETAVQWQLICTHTGGYGLMLCMESSRLSWVILQGT